MTDVAVASFVHVFMLFFFIAERVSVIGVPSAGWMLSCDGIKCWYIGWLENISWYYIFVDI